MKISLKIRCPVSVHGSTDLQCFCFQTFQIRQGSQLLFVPISHCQIYDPFCFQRSSTLAYSFDDGEAGFTVLVGVNLPVNWNGAFAEDKKHTLQIHWGWIDASSFCTFNWYFSARNSARSIQLLLDSYISLVFFNLIFLSRYDRDG